MEGIQKAKPVSMCECPVCKRRLLMRSSVRHGKIVQIVASHEFNGVVCSGSNKIPEKTFKSIPSR